MILGRRKLVRKWNEEIMRFQMEVRVNSRMACGNQAAPALALLSGQILECLLKAFLSKVGRVTENELKNLAHNHSEQLWQRAETLGLVAGVTESELKNKVRHNLLELWQRAEKLGLSIGSMPGWVEILNRLHDSPYYLRYPMGLHGLGLPNAQQMTSELTTILDLLLGA
jgi:hypothetical protein